MSSLNLGDLRSVCSADISEFFELQGCKVGGRSLYPYGFFDNGGSVLGVAHLDFVSLPFHYANVKLYDGLTIFCTRLDDRLGAYGLLHYLPKVLGVLGFDVLLTTGEESGNSSASSFVTNKSYNWIFELDRRGTDAVTYDIESKRFKRALKSSGWNIGRGSFSDICYLDDFGLCAVNFGIGYENEHTKLHFANWSIARRQFKRISQFIELYRNTNFQFGGYKTKSIKPIGYTSYKWYGDDDYSDRFIAKSSTKPIKSSGYNFPDDIVDDAEFDELVDAYCDVCGVQLNRFEVECGRCDDCINYK